MKNKILENSKENKLLNKRQLILHIKKAFSGNDWNDLNSASLLMTCHYPEEMLGWSALGASLSFQNRHQEAIGPMAKAVELSPNNVVALINLALALQNTNQYPQSKKVIDRALSIDKNHAASYNALGRYFQKTENPIEAENNYNRSIQLQPLNVDAYSNLGNLYCELGNLSAAIKIYEAAINLHIDNPELRNNLGVAMMMFGDYKKAELLFKNIIKKQPNYTKAKANYGSCLYNQGKYEEAVDVLQLSILEDESNSEAYCNLGLAYAASKRTNEAIKTLKKAIEINPNRCEAYNCLAGVLKEIGNNEEACKLYLKAVSLKENYNTAFSNYLFCSLHSHSISDHELFIRHKEYSDRYEKKIDEYTVFLNSKDANRALKIGFVSGDLYHHAVSSFALPYVTSLNKEKFEVYIYSNTIIKDEVSEYYEANVFKWHNVVGLGDIELLELIRSDHIDILIDLSGHTSRNRLLVFANRAAPIQATWIGYPYTTGLKAIDYYFTDRHTAPPGLYEKYWTEKFVWMPNAGVFRPELNAPNVGPLPAISNGFITFGSFNRFTKINTEVIKVWAEILREIPESKMIIANIENPDTRDKLINDLGVVPHRIEFHGRLRIVDYLELHNKIDIHLDPWPYTGGTTTMHAAWMGLPTITMRGNSIASNFGAAILSKIKLNQFISVDAKDYISIAKKISSNLSELEVIRKNLRVQTQNSMLCNMKISVDGFQYALIAMWYQWCKSIKPRHIEVGQDAVGNWIMKQVDI